MSDNPEQKQEVPATAIQYTDSIANHVKIGDVSLASPSTSIHDLIAEAVKLLKIKEV